jgi:hypothetical protein
VHCGPTSQAMPSPNAGPYSPLARRKAALRGGRLPPPKRTPPEPPIVREARERTRPLKIYVTPRQREEIEARAASVGMSVSSFLGALGLNAPIRSRTDADAVLDLLRINGDLGRLGGLLNQWLSERAGQGARIIEVHDVLHAIEETRQELLRVSSRVLRS